MSFTHASSRPGVFLPLALSTCVLRTPCLSSLLPLSAQLTVLPTGCGVAAAEPGSGEDGDRSGAQPGKYNLSLMLVTGRSDLGLLYKITLY